jgi:hypothetical protein
MECGWMNGCDIEVPAGWRHFRDVLLPDCSGRNELNNSLLLTINLQLFTVNY